KGHPYAGIDRQRRAEHLGTRIVQDDRQLYIRDITRVKECPKKRDPLVECVVDPSKNLNLRGELIRGVQIDSPIAGQFRVLIGVVSDKVPATDDCHVCADCPTWCGRVKGAEFFLVQWQTWNPVSRDHMDVAVLVGQRVIRGGEVAGEFVRRVEKT